MGFPVGKASVADLIIEVQRALGWEQMASPFAYNNNPGDGLNHVLAALNWASSDFLGKHPYREKCEMTAVLKGTNKIDYPSDYNSTICIKVDDENSNIWVRATLVILQALTSATVKVGDLGVSLATNAYYICTAASLAGSSWSISPYKPSQYDLNLFEGNIRDLTDDVNDTGYPKLYVPMNDYIRFDVYADSDYPMEHWYNAFDDPITVISTNYSALQFWLQSRFGLVGSELLKCGALHYIKKDMEEYAAAKIHEQDWIEAQIAVEMVHGNVGKQTVRITPF